MMDVAVRTKFILIAFGFVASEISVINFLAGTRWTFLLPLFVILFGISGMRVSCPKCRRPAGLREMKTGIGHVKIWGIPPAKCPRCGWPFDEVYRRKSQGGGKKSK